MTWTIEAAVFVAMFCFTYGLAMAWTRWNQGEGACRQSGHHGGDPSIGPGKKASRLKKWSVEWLAYSGAMGLAQSG